MWKNYRGRSSRRGTWAAVFAFSDVEQYVLSLLSPGFPWHDKPTELYTHEALFVVPMSFFRPNAAPMAYVPQPVSISMINHQLGANPGGEQSLAGTESLRRTGDRGG